jgi:hypothetical protein
MFERRTRQNTDAPHTNSLTVRRESGRLHYVRDCSAARTPAAVAGRLAGQPVVMSRWTCSTCCWGDRGRAERWLRCPRPRWCESSATTRRRFSMSRIAELHFLLHVPMESAATELVRTRRSSIQVHAGPDLNRPKRMRTANMTCISDRQASHWTTPGDTVYHGSAQSAGAAEHTD